MSALHSLPITGKNGHQQYVGARYLASKILAQPVKSNFQMQLPHSPQCDTVAIVIHYQLKGGVFP
jgi:hypothetical protein